MNCLLSCLSSPAVLFFGSLFSSYAGDIIPSSNLIRIGYTLQLLLFGIIIWIVDYISKWSREIPILKHLGFLSQPILGISIGDIGPYRISLGLALYHLFLAIFLIGVGTRTSARAQLHQSYGLIKFPILVALVAMSLRVPSTILIAYIYFANCGSGIFVLIIITWLIELTHDWGELLVSKHEKYNNLFSSLSLSLLVLLLYTSVVFGHVLVYFYTLANHLNYWIFSVSIISCIIMTLISICPVIQEVSPYSGLVQPAIISNFCTMLIVSATMNQLGRMEEEYPTMYRIGIRYSLISNTILVFSAMIYNNISHHNSGYDCCLSNDETKKLLQTLIHEDIPVQSGSNDPTVATTMTMNNQPKYNYYNDMKDYSFDCIAKKVDLITQEQQSVPYSYSWFHFCHFLAALSLPCLLDTYEFSSYIRYNFKINYISIFWIRIIASWIAIVLYLWSLIAPLVFPERQFHTTQM